MLGRANPRYGCGPGWEFSWSGRVTGLPILCTSQQSQFSLACGEEWNHLSPMQGEVLWRGSESAFLLGSSERQKGTLCGTLLPVPLGWMKRCSEKKRRIVLCFPSFILVFVSLFAMLCFVFIFSLGDAAGVREGYGGTERWEELGCMMWNFQRINEEIMCIKQKSSCYYFGAGKPKKIRLHSISPHTIKKYFSSIKLV